MIKVCCVSVCKIVGLPLYGGLRYQMILLIRCWGELVTETRARPSSSFSLKASQLSFRQFSSSSLPC